MNQSELKDFLEEKVLQYNTRFYWQWPRTNSTPFTLKEDIEIAGFLSATIAWGNRKWLSRMHKMIDLMGNAPYDYIMSHTDKNLEQLEALCIEL
jgi:hypothetical protein